MTQPITLVTGVSRGIGEAVAADLTRRGHHVIGLARSKPEGFEGTFVGVDLSDGEALKLALADVTSRHNILYLVNNAGVAQIAPSDEATLEQFDTMMAVNVRAVMQTMQAVIPAMRQAGFGRIVNIGSRAAMGKDGRLIYGASKAAVLSMTRTVALEYAKTGITANCIAPGPIETAMIKLNYPEGSEPRAALVGQVPMRRMGTPNEIAHAVSYFLDDAAGFTTGQVLYVCGGLSVGSVPV
jgi:3-oxoacyl-[acyl-carrier protein] reductase